ncbi:MAG: magnesium/cobalt transporter CorA [Thermomicrobiales bacterium]|nr:magnesium/cobalt transporter CorA [Thermomicrobiales bacterium]
MIKVILHNNDQKAIIDAPVEELPEIVAREHSMLWVDLTDPTLDEIAAIGKVFSFHPLALEDTMADDIRPKIDQYEGYAFIAFYGMTHSVAGCHSHSVDIFIGSNYMVTCHDSALPVIDETATRWRQNVAALGNRGSGFLLYSLLDALVDGYFPVIDQITERAEELEELVLNGGEPRLQADIMALRRELLMIRRVAGPERDVMNVLVRRDPPYFGKKEIAYFQDVYDHLLRIIDSVDLTRDMLAGVLDANLSMVSYNLNVVVKRLTSSSIILMSVTLVAGIYGMNFVNMPELDWRFGYAFALGLMAVIGVAEFLVFKKIDWL